MDKNKLHLPKHSPNERVWNAIENKLNNQDSIKSLPHYSPSEEVWNRIEKRQQRSSILILSNWMKIAASIVFLIGVGYLITLLNPREEIKITYSEVWIEPMDVESWNLEEDKTIAVLIEQKEMESPMLLMSEEYQLLKKEYNNLLYSKQLVLNEVNPYNENVELELILTRIELQKNSIVRSLISFNVV